MSSRAEDFDRADFDIDDDEPAEPAKVVPVAVEPVPAVVEPTKAARALWMWPIDPRLIIRVGQTSGVYRPKKKRFHEGLDIFTKAGTRVYAATSGTVIRVIDGRTSKDPKRRGAGLYMDFLTDVQSDGVQYIQRYLHMGSIRQEIKKGFQLAKNDPIGDVAGPHKSGLSDDPHLHFEVRAVRGTAYGAPLDPRRFLPQLQTA